jgi:hypothetical protein
MCDEASVVYSYQSDITQGGCNLAHYSAICFAITGCAGHVNLIGFTGDEKKSKDVDPVSLLAKHQSGQNVDAASSNNIKCTLDMNAATKSSFVVLCVDGDDVQACGNQLANMYVAFDTAEQTD